MRGTGKLSSNNKIIIIIRILLEGLWSTVKCRTLNRESPGSNPLCCCFKAWITINSPRNERVKEVEAV